MRLLLLLVPLLVLTACDSADPSSSGNVVEAVAMETGMRWTYTYKTTRYGPRVGETAPDSLELVEVDNVVITVTNRNATVGDEEGLIELRGVSDREGPFAMWYREAAGGLVLVAEDDFPGGGVAAWVTPFTSDPPGGASPYHRGGDECGTTESGDGYCIRTYPYRAYEYPFTVGRSWTVSSVPDLVTLRRTVTAQGETTTPAGTFQTATVANDWDLETLAGTEYVAREGLVRREVRSEVRWFSETGQPDGVRIFSREMELVRLERP